MFKVIWQKVLELKNCLFLLLTVTVTYSLEKYNMILEISLSLVLIFCQQFDQGYEGLCRII